MLKREFSWSFTRYRIFERCPRAYYFHYYGSWGGWDFNAHEKTKLLYRLKNLQDINIFVWNIFRESLFNIFNEQKLNIGYLKRNALFRLRRELFSMRNKEFESNPKNKLLKEVFLEMDDPINLIDICKSKINSIIALFSKSQAWEILNSIDHLNFKNIKEPSSFLLNGIKIWTKPDFIWSDKGRIHIINLYLKDPLDSDTWAFKATLDRMLVKDIFPGHNEISVSSFFLHQIGFPEITISRNRKEVLRIIDESCQKMLEITDLDTNIKQDLFPKIESMKCDYCNFRKACLS